MAITVKNKSAKLVKAKDFKEGKAYMYGDTYACEIYICNPMHVDGDIVQGFSLCGTKVAWASDEESNYQEVDLDIAFSII